MPRLADLRRQYVSATEFSDRETHAGESLVSDVRSRLSSSEMVEKKVGAALGLCYWIVGGVRGSVRSASRRSHA